MGDCRDEIDSAWRDAARYRWLREGDNDELVLLNSDGSPVPVSDPDKSPACFLPRLERLDAAIDAAMVRYTLTPLGAAMLEGKKNG